MLAILYTILGVNRGLKDLWIRIVKFYYYNLLSRNRHPEIDWTNEETFFLLYYFSNKNICQSHFYRSMSSRWSHLFQSQHFAGLTFVGSALLWAKAATLGWGFYPTTCFFSKQTLWVSPKMSTTFQGAFHKSCVFFLAPNPKPRQFLFFGQPSHGTRISTCSDLSSRPWEWSEPVEPVVFLFTPSLPRWKNVGFNVIYVRFAILQTWPFWDG